MMLPEAFKERIRTQKYLNAEEIFSALEKPSLTSVRINREKWKKNPAGSVLVAWCKDGYYIDKRPSFTFDPLFHAGCYYPQESSGMFLEHILRSVGLSTGKIRALDLCAAPGGKATHLSSIIGSRGFLIANEVIKSRASVLAENITKWGTGNTLVTRNDPSDFKGLRGFFDIILVDAPCSGEGMFRDPEARREWSPENAALCASRQKRILTDIWPCLRNDGILVYSTCTFNPAENEDNVRWLISGKGAESVTVNISDFSDITEIEADGAFGYGFYPGRTAGEGLFISVIRKKENAEMTPLRQNPGNKLRLTREEARLISEWITDDDSQLLKMGERVMALPCSINELQIISEILRIVKSGTAIGTFRKNRFDPDHELSMFRRFRNEACPVLDLDYDQALGFLSRKNPVAGDLPRGWINARYQGVSLGFLNNVGNRLNNYYPMEWRIRMHRSLSGREEIIKWQLDS